MYRYATAIGIDIGRFSIHAALVRMGGELLYEESFPMNIPREKDHLLTELIRVINTVRRKVAADAYNPIAIGISVKGFIDHSQGIVQYSGEGIKGWENVQLAKIISRETSLPVYAGNDANLMTIAEQNFGSALGYENIVFVALRTGIGGGIVINGKLYRGMNDAGGEIGQMIIRYDFCSGKGFMTGSFENLASASALVRRYREETGTTEGASIITAGEIFRRSYGKDSAAKMVVRENATIVGIGLANIVAIFAPEIIVIGGGMGEERESYLKMIRQNVIKHTPAACCRELKIERAALGRKAALIGAAFYSLSRLAGKTF